MKKILMIPALLALLASSCGNDSSTELTQANPKAPTGLILHGSTETTLTFQWDDMDGATGYEWQLAKGTAVIGSGTVKPRNVVLDGLEKVTTYIFSVASLGENGYKSSFSKVEATTEGEDNNSGNDDPVNPPVTTVSYADYQIPSYEEEDGKARAFPGAEGGGMWTTGGRGGAVYHVTNLNDKGDGSLRWAVEKSGARTIVFDVAGVIALASPLVIKNGDVTIAGQTAPGDGICLKNYTFRINASNVIVRFIRCRMGDEANYENDAIQIMDHDDDKFQNIIIDHCSVSWCTDECASFYGMKDFTFSWNFVTESLRNSIHGKGAHGYGGIWGGTNASYHHNLLAHHDSRNPRIDHDYVSTQKGPVSIVNNVIYNWSGNTCYGGESKAGAAYRKYNIVNNYYKPGPASKASKKIWFLDPMVKCSNCESSDPTSVTPGHFYMTGNYMDGYSTMTADNWTGTTAKDELIATIRASSPFTYSANPTSISLQTPQNAFDAVVEYAGASFSRDAVDQRIARETKNGNYTYSGSNGSSSGLIDTQSDVGGWPSYIASDEETALVKDTDRDGIPDWFEDAAGLDKNSASDGAAKALDTKGRYTNLEMYLHYLVRETVAAQTEGGTYTIL